MFCLIELIGVVCRVSKVLSTDDTASLENIFCFCTLVSKRCLNQNLSLSLLHMAMQTFWHRFT